MKDPKDLKRIQEIRNSIDEIDHRILELFGDRNRFIEEIVKFKTDKEDIVAKKRQKEIFAARRKWAEDFNLNPDLFEEIFKMLINSNIQKELDILEHRKDYKIK
jgi:isochorismate pyruvate lyase